MSQRRYIQLQRDAADLQLLLYHESRVADLIERMDERGADTGKMNKLSALLFAEAVGKLAVILPEMPAFDEAVSHVRDENLKVIKHSCRIKSSSTSSRH